MPIAYVAHTIVGPFSFNTYVKGSYLSGCYCQESSSSAYTTNPLTILLLLHLDSLFLARYGGETFNLNYRLKFFFFFPFSLSQQESKKQAGHSKNINKLSQAEVSSISGCFEGKGKARGDGRRQRRRRRSWARRWGKKEPTESNAKWGWADQPLLP